MTAPWSFSPDDLPHGYLPSNEHIAIYNGKDFLGAFRFSKRGYDQVKRRYIMADFVKNLRLTPRGTFMLTLNSHRIYIFDVGKLEVPVKPKCKRISQTEYQTYEAFNLVLKPQDEFTIGSGYMEINN